MKFFFIKERFCRVKEKLYIQHLFSYLKEIFCDQRKTLNQNKKNYHAEGVKIFEVFFSKNIKGKRGKI